MHGYDAPAEPGSLMRAATAPQPVPEHALDYLRSRLAEMVKAASEVATRVEQTADRVFGQRPEKDQAANGVAIAPDGELGGAHSQMDELAWHIGRASAAMDRLGSL